MLFVMTLIIQVLLMSLFWSMCSRSSIYKHRHSNGSSIYWLNSCTKWPTNIKLYPFWHR